MYVKLIFFDIEIEFSDYRHIEDYKMDFLLSKCGCTKGSLITVGRRSSMVKIMFTMNLL